MASSWANPDPLGSHDALDVETFRLIHNARTFALLLIVLAAVIVGGWVGMHDQCASLTRNGATTAVLHQKGCQP